MGAVPGTLWKGMVLVWEKRKNRKWNIAIIESLPEAPS